MLLFHNVFAQTTKINIEKNIKIYLALTFKFFWNQQSKELLQDMHNRI